jgi:hypothetical protein
MLAFPIRTISAVIQLGVAATSVAFITLLLGMSQAWAEDSGSPNAKVEKALKDLNTIVDGQVNAQGNKICVTLTDVSEYKNSIRMKKVEQCAAVWDLESTVANPIPGMPVGPASVRHGWLAIKCISKTGASNPAVEFNGCVETKTFYGDKIPEPTKYEFASQGLDESLAFRLRSGTPTQTDADYIFALLEADLERIRASLEQR